MERKLAVPVTKVSDKLSVILLQPISCFFLIFRTQLCWSGSLTVILYDLEKSSPIGERSHLKFCKFPAVLDLQFIIKKLPYKCIYKVSSFKTRWKNRDPTNVYSMQSDLGKLIMLRIQAVQSPTVSQHYVHNYINRWSSLTMISLKSKPLQPSEIFLKPGCPMRSFTSISFFKYIVSHTRPAPQKNLWS